MKFFAVFAAIVAVACAAQDQWTINELSAAIQDPNTDPAVMPLLMDALNELMFATMTGSPQTTVSVSTASQDVTSWTLPEISNAIQDPSTNPELLPYLEHALNVMMQNLFDGQQQEVIIIATPAGLLAPETGLAPIVVDTPVAPIVVDTPVAPIVVDTPVVAEAPAVSSSPLVQIIVNVNQKEAVSAPSPVVPPTPVIVAPSPVVPPTPVIVAPSPVVPPTPVIVAPSPVVPPSPVIVAPSPVIPPSPVIVAPAPTVPVNPVDVVAITPPEAVINPVDVVAITPPQVVINPVDVVAIAAPEVNPIDIANPIIVPAAVAGQVVGPIL